jgi:hypothetical protein
LLYGMSLLKSIEAVGDGAGSVAIFINARLIALGGADTAPPRPEPGAKRVLNFHLLPPATAARVDQVLGKR